MTEQKAREFRKGDPVTVLPRLNSGLNSRGHIRTKNPRQVEVIFKNVMDSGVEEIEVVSFYSYELVHGHNVQITGEEVPERVRSIVINYDSIQPIYDDGPCVGYLLENVPEEIAALLEEWQDHIEKKD